MNSTKASLSKKIILVAGPTASGKTAKAILIAKQVNGELINADSRQIYKLLDIGTNKGVLTKIGEDHISGVSYPVFEVDNSGVAIHLIGFLNPNERFSAFEFRDLCWEVINNLWQIGKTPVLVGGSGLYIDAVINPDRYSDTTLAANPELREQLSRLSVQQLQQRLKQLLPSSLSAMNTSDKQNPRRLVRAIEKATSTAPQIPTMLPKSGIDYELKVEYLEPDWATLTHKINTRVEQMFSQGLVAEVEAVLGMGYPSTSIALQGIGYKEVIMYIQNQISYADCVTKVKTAHRQYAKRQVTWFKKYLITSYNPAV